ncbi:hypothetical protein ACHAPJ_010828 [Fusarium lateritium]
MTPTSERRDDEANRPIVICGPSGVGKGTLIKRLTEAHPDKFTTIISHTTRPKRPNEKDDVHYSFRSKGQFESLLHFEEFIEHTIYNGHYYGTCWRTVKHQMSQGLTPLLDINIEGVRNLQGSQNLNPRCVFIKPPSLDVLRARLQARGTEDEESIKERLAQAKVELEYAETAGAFDVIIVNDDIEEAYKQLEAFVRGVIETKYVMVEEAGDSCSRCNSD